jgi:hypothetical protein
MGAPFFVFLPSPKTRKGVLPKWGGVPPKWGGVLKRLKVEAPRPIVEPFLSNVEALRSIVEPFLSSIEAQRSNLEPFWANVEVLRSIVEPFLSNVEPMKYKLVFRRLNDEHVNGCKKIYNP